MHYPLQAWLIFESLIQKLARPASLVTCLSWHCTNFYRLLQSILIQSTMARTFEILSGHVTMLRLNKLTDYAVILLAGIAEAGEGVVSSAAFLSERFQITYPTVSKLLRILSQARLLYSVRGTEGGYCLLDRPEEITLVRIIEAVEGPVGAVKCSVSGEVCVRQSSCRTQFAWQEVHEKMKNLLSSYTLAHFLNDRTIQARSI